MFVRLRASVELMESIVRKREDQSFSIIIRAFSDRDFTMDSTMARL